MATLKTYIDQIGEDTDTFHEFVHGTSSGYTQTESGPLMTLPEAEDQILEQIAAYTNINPRGEWATATDYEIKDIVYEELDSSSASGPTFYICLYAHTSGTFGTDYSSGYWAIWQNAYGGAITVPTLAALAITKAAYTGQVAYLEGRSSTNDGGQGVWVLTAGNFTTELGNDTENGVYLEYFGEDGSTRAWVRQHNGFVRASWFNTLNGAISAGFKNIELSPDTTYTITTALVPLEGSTIRGPKTSKVTTAETITLFELTNSNVTLEGFEIDAGSGYWCIRADTVDHIYIRNMEIHGANGVGVASIKFDDAVDNFEIIGCEVYGTEQHVGIQLQECSNGIISGNDVHDNGRGGAAYPGAGIELQGCVSVTISNNIIYDNNWMAIILEDEGGVESNNIIIDGNVCTNNQGEHTATTATEIHIETNGKFTVTNNIVTIETGTSANRGIMSDHDESGYYGSIIANNTIVGDLDYTIGISMSWGDIISGNKIKSCNRGIGDISLKDDITIIGNQIVDCQLTGIDIHSTTAQNAERIIIEGNNIKNCGIQNTAGDYTEVAISVGSSVTLINCSISNNIIEDVQGTPTTHAGIHIDGLVRYSKIDGNLIKGVEGIGIYIANIAFSSINGNHIYGGTGHINIVTAEDISVSNNKSITASHADGAICLFNIIKSSVCGNTVNGVTGPGIQIDPTNRHIRYNVVSNNIINSCSGAGILVDSDATYGCYNTVFSGNMCNGNSVGIINSTDGVSDYNVIVANVLYSNNSTSDIDTGTWGASSQIANNVNL